ncbi:glycyl-radical enzyme activating protein, partial [Salmonella enterica subsp. enterica serovar Paratyphi B]
MIFNIQRYSTHDGPGIRTVVFPGSYTNPRAHETLRS